MKYFLNLLVLVILFNGCTFKNNDLGYTAWLSGINYQKEFERIIKKNVYSDKAEGRCHESKPQFRAYFMPYFTRKFNFIARHGISKYSFTKENIEYNSKGFRLHFINDFTCNNITYYQAVWIKRQY